MTTLIAPAGQNSRGTGPAALSPAAAPTPDGETRSRSSRVLRGLGRTVAIFVPVILLSTFITYGLGALSDTNPAAAVLGETATPKDIARLNHQFGLDRPFLSQYGHWIWGVLHGNLGSSYFTQIPVSTSIKQRLPVDLSLALVAIALAVAIGTALGVAAAVRRGGIVDRLITAVCAVFMSVPSFVVAIVLVVLFATTWHIFPAVGYVPPTLDTGQWLLHILLPSFALSLETAMAIARQLRTSLVRELGENYVVGAEIRGLARTRTLWVHVLRNGSGPALTVLGAGIPVMIGGAVVTETVFSLPGLGQLAIHAAEQRDIPVVQGVLLVTSVLVIVSNLLVNVGIARLRPGGSR
jgi:peptide/nickel transport system permease protein